MSVDSTNNRGQYTGNGSTTIFAVAASGVAIPFFATSDLVVTLFDTAAGALVSPAPVLGGGATYDYTVTGTTDPNSGEFLTANVTFNTAPLGNHRVTIQRAVPATQDVALADNSKFPAAVVVAALDRLTILVQQALAAAGLALQFPATDPIGLGVTLPASAARANLFAAFDASGQMIASPGPSGGTPIATAMVPVVQAASLAAALALLGGAGTGIANTFAAAQILKSTTAGAAVETILTLLRNKGAGAASDFLEALAFDGMNAATAEKSFARIVGQIVTATAATEAGRLILRTLVAGAETDILTLGPGAQLGAPTGGDKGAGTLNAASGLYDNNSRVLPHPWVKSSEYAPADQAITAGGLLTLAHGLGVRPKVVAVTAIAGSSTEGGYSAGAEIDLSHAPGSNTAVRGLSVLRDATNITIRFGNDAAPFYILNSGGTAVTGITPANWTLRVRAYA